MTKIGTCKLCLKEKNLQNSHAVGDSIFKKIFRENSGKAIAFSSGGNEVSYSSDSWAEKQLCEECEKHLNNNYEKYSLGVLRARYGQVKRGDAGVTFSGVDLQKLSLYFLSIYWRAANSGHPSYKQALIMSKDNEFLRKAIFENSRVPISRFTIKLSRLADMSNSKGFTLRELKRLIVSPFSRIHEDLKVRNVSTCFLFEGFFIEIYMPGLRASLRKHQGIIHKSKKVLFVPYINIFDIQEVFDLMVKGYGAYHEGRSRIKANNSRKRSANTQGVDSRSQEQRKTLLDN